MFGLSSSTLLLLPLALGLVAVLVLVVHFRPKIGVVLWLCTAAFVPFWLGVTFVVYFMPTSAVGLLVLAALHPAPRRLGGFDLVAAFFFVCCAAPAISGGATISTLFGAVAYWLVAYLLGRLAPIKVDLVWIYGCAAVVFTVVAGLAIAEFFFSWNPFVTLGPATPLHEMWGVLQSRGDLVRAEGAFGHSIALGCTLALALPLTLGSRFRDPVKLVMVAIMMGAVVVTISRIAIICAVLGVVLSVTLARDGLSRTLRVWTLGLLAGVGVALSPYLLSVFQAAGDEATNSANYRGDLTELIPDISLLGFSSAAYRSPTGELFFGRFQSIDSQILFTGLTYGWMALMCGLVLLVGAVVATVRRLGTVATIAVVAQIPALATVALITQYSMVFWFVAGLAVCSQVGREQMGSGTMAGKAPPARSAALP